jgi:uncharacterized SAM-binding protein YcdF (DUF218 family)
MRRKLTALGIILSILFGIYFSYPLVLEGLAKFLIVTDKIEKADLILVLGGDDNGERVAEGIKLFKQGYANRILMSGGPLVWNLTFAGVMQKQALAGGVPGKAILLQKKSRSTKEDAKFSLPIIQQQGFKSIILITSPQHTRRAARIFRKIFPADIRLMVWPAQKSAFNPKRFWTRHEDISFVAWEYLALVLYFLEGY